MKTKDGYIKLIEGKVKGDVNNVLLSDGGSVVKSVTSTANSLVLRNASGLIESSVATGTSPFKITSTTLNTNLNADLLDGKHLSEILASDITGTSSRSKQLVTYTVVPFSSGTYNVWYKFASISVSGRYSGAFANFKLYSGKKTSTTTLSSECNISFNCYQLNEVGLAPAYGITYDNDSEFMEVVVILNYSASGFTFDFYARVLTQDYHELIGVLINGNGLFISNGVRTETLPSGTQITPSYNKKVKFAVSAEGASKATNLSSGSLGAIPYQTAANTTTFLVAATTNGAVLKYDTTNKKPYWSTDNNSWRPVKLTDGSTETNVVNDNSSTLKFKAGSNVTLSTSGGVITIAATDTDTWTAWKGATASAAGTAGYMPAPTAALRNLFLRGDGQWVSLNNYSLPTASDTVLGGVKTGAALTDVTGYTKVHIKDGVLYYKDNNTTYTFYNLAFQNSSGTTVDTYKPTTSPSKTIKAGSNISISAASNVITIAATDTTYGVVSSSANGLAPKMPTSNTTAIATRADEWVLTTTKGGTPTWRLLPSNAFNDHTYDLSPYYKILELMGNSSGAWDWDSYSTIGTYKVQNGSSITNHPKYNGTNSAYQFGLAMIIRGMASDGEARISQIYFPRVATGNIPMYTRMRNSNTWTSWWGIPSTTYVDNKCANYLPLSGGTLTSSTYATQLIINRNLLGANSVIKFTNSDGDLGNVGFCGSNGTYPGELFVRKGNSDYKIWHEGNLTPSNYLLASNYTASDILTKLKTVDGADSGLDADLLDGQHASAFVTRIGRYYLYSSNVKPYAYVHLFRIGVSSGYSARSFDFSIKTRYYSVDFYINISTSQYPYNSTGSSIVIHKEVKSGRDINLYYVSTINSSGYNYYDVYCLITAWNEGYYDLVNLGGSGTVVFEDKRIYVDSLPTGYTAVTESYVSKATYANNADTLDGWHLSSFYTNDSTATLGGTTSSPTSLLVRYSNTSSTANSPYSLLGGNLCLALNLHCGNDYMSQLAFNFGSDYLAIRRKVGSTTWGNWTKIKAGYADSASVATRLNTKLVFTSTGYRKIMTLKATSRYGGASGVVLFHQGTCVTSTGIGKICNLYCLMYQQNAMGGTPCYSLLTDCEQSTSLKLYAILNYSSTESVIDIYIYVGYGYCYTVGTIISGSLEFSLGDVLSSLPTTGTLLTIGNFGISKYANTLTTARTIWGQSFDGSANISGAISNTGAISSSQDSTYDIGSSTNQYRYMYASWFGAKTGGALSLGANNASHVKIDTSGNVGIGITSPGTKLDVSGNIRSYSSSTGAMMVSAQNSLCRVNIYAAASGNHGLHSTTADSWIIYTNGTNTFIPNGNVGINTTSPSYKLHVSGTGGFTDKVTLQKGWAVSWTDTSNDSDGTARPWYGCTYSNSSGNTNNVMLSGYFGITYRTGGTSYNHVFKGGHVRPDANNTQTLGTSSYKWNNVYATTFTGALSGNASTASKLATARTISLTGSVTGSVSFDGSGNVSIATTTNHTHAYVPIEGLFFNQYNAGTYTKILEFTISSRAYDPSISFTWHPTECARDIWADFNINIRDNGIIFKANWKGNSSRTLTCVGNGTIFSVWVSGTKSNYDPYGMIQVTHVHSINSYSAGRLQVTDTVPSGTYSKECTTSGYAASAGNADTVDSYHISVGAAGTNSSTIYFVT